MFTTNTPRQMKEVLFCLVDYCKSELNCKMEET